jgi:hypothetical protein
LYAGYAVKKDVRSCFHEGLHFYMRNFARIPGQDPGNLCNIFKSNLFYTTNFETLFDVEKISQDPGPGSWPALCRSPYFPVFHEDKTPV